MGRVQPRQPHGLLHRLEDSTRRGSWNLSMKKRYVNGSPRRGVPRTKVRLPNGSMPPHAPSHSMQHTLLPEILWYPAQSSGVTLQWFLKAGFQSKPYFDRFYRITAGVAGPYLYRAEKFGKIPPESAAKLTRWKRLSALLWSASAARREFLRYDSALGPTGHPDLVADAGGLVGIVNCHRIDEDAPRQLAHD